MGPVGLQGEDLEGLLSAGLEEVQAGARAVLVEVLEAAGEDSARQPAVAHLAGEGSVGPADLAEAVGAAAAD
jgi:hypothetical protein